MGPVDFLGGRRERRGGFWGVSACEGMVSVVA